MASDSDDGDSPSHSSAYFQCKLVARGFFHVACWACWAAWAPCCLLSGCSTGLHGWVMQTCSLVWCRTKHSVHAMNPCHMCASSMAAAAAARHAHAQPPVLSSAFACGPSHEHSSSAQQAIMPYSHCCAARYPSACCVPLNTAVPAGTACCM